MSDAKCRPEPAPGLAGRAFTLTLSPLSAPGRASLAPDPSLGISRVSLVELAKRWPNAFNQVTIRRADDLFACAELARAGCDALPQGAEAIEATLEFECAGAPEPRRVTLKPPRTLVLEPPGDNQWVLDFLVRRGFLVPS